MHEHDTPTTRDAASVAHACATRREAHDRQVFNALMHAYDTDLRNARRELLGSLTRPGATFRDRHAARLLHGGQTRHTTNRLATALDHFGLGDTAWEVSA